MINQNPMQPMQAPGQPPMPQGVASPVEAVKSVRDPAQLVQMANDPRNVTLQLAALSEIQARKQKAIQANGARARAPQQTVKEQVLNGMPPQPPQPQPPQPMDVANPAMMAQGIPALPTGNAIPRQYSGGGIVAFQSGGITDEKGIWNKREREQWAPVGRFGERLLAGAADAATLIPRGVIGAGNAVLSGARALGIPVTYQLDPFAPYGSDPTSLTPWGDLLDKKYAAAEAPAAAAPSPATDTPPWFGATSPAPLMTPPMALPPTGDGGKAGARTGIASLGKGPAFPKYTDPYEGAPKYTTEAQRDAMVAAEYERLKKLYGPDIAEKYLAEIQAERKGMDKKYEDSRNEAMLRTGLAIMGGKSKHAAVNIGEGGIAGLNAWQAGKRDLDQQAAALRREEMAAALGQQARQDTMRGQAVTRGDAAATRADRARGEYIEQARDQRDYGVKGAEFGLKARELDIKMAAVLVEQARNDIMHGASKMDVMARIYQTAQEAAWKQVTEDPRNAALGMEQKGQLARELAQEMIANNAALQKIMGNGGATAMPQRISWPGQLPVSRAPR